MKCSSKTRNSGCHYNDNNDTYEDNYRDMRKFRTNCPPIEDVKKIVNDMNTFFFDKIVKKNKNG